ncbi:asparagine synthase (glutamine-hydrolyzing) [Propionivibrio sp.]|uniref:asparagine synthase (glutamine-hydrolyzing) n=1 Tax=Propionivibrio sp. TaxID=2212460 RepID=UPI00263123B6|nr:asparagine synthase (glutamine-hydrolyzing) [Propionivibrio sp.]
MCGLAGVLGLAALDHQPIASVMGLMIAPLQHRGPDDQGVWCDNDEAVGLAHVRLSVLDLSSAGHQPMHSHCGRYVIVFNGEIYNHLDLRVELQTSALTPWRGQSDTETLLACFSVWGVEKTLKATVGMFAFALWDRQERKLVLARDRLGEKPLYYGYVAGAFAFASELKALKALPGFSGEVDRGALALLLRHNCIPAPYSIYRGLSKLMPGTWLELTSDAMRQQQMPQPLAYWSALAAAMTGVSKPFTFASDAQAVAALEAELSRAVAGQMLADVPLGAFLSGGIDSSAVVALMQTQSSRPVKSFSIGFREAGYDEAIYASEVARHIGTEHTELYVSPQDALAVIPKLPTIYDEPFSDSSQIPTYLVAQLARERVTVALSGDGGDELFGGYSRYFLAARLWGKIELMPHALRRAVAHVIFSLSPQAWDNIYRLAAPFIPKAHRWPAPGDKLHKGATLLDAASGMGLYRGLVSHWEPSDVVLGAAEPETPLSGRPPSLPSLTEQMMLLDALNYLPNDILVKVDRAAMAVSLESRVPLIDHRIFEFAWRLPMHYKVRGGTGKWLLRQVLYKHVPAALVDRPKMGFGVPIDSWLRGPLREWAEELLGEERLRREGYFQPAPIRRKWKEHLSGQRNWQYHLWDVLMYQAWLEAENASP